MINKKNKKIIPKAVSQNKLNMQTPIGTKQRFSAQVKLMILLGLISCIVYANTLKNGFVLDDSNVITENTIVTKGISAIPELPFRYSAIFHF